MKLLTKTTLYFATLSLFLFFIMGIIFFQVLKNISLSELNREMAEIREAVDLQLDKEWATRPPRIIGIDSLTIQLVSASSTMEEKYGDTLMIDPESDQFKTYRYLEYFQKLEEGNVKVRIYKSTTPTDKLVEQVTLMMTMMVILFLSGVFFMNRFVFANLWKDFFEALEKLRKFDTVKEPVVLGDQDIEEFKELKAVLEKMTRRLSSDYKELREYTDHTTHELQTPLAVIKTKIELLLQSENLGPDEMQLIQSINTSVDHLSRLNSTLALITRIENQQFPEKNEIHLVRLVDHHLEMLQELIEIRNISVVRSYKDTHRTICMDQGLADVMIANLLKNAIVHNVDGGKITLDISSEAFTIGNEGPQLEFGEEELFRKFVRSRSNKGSFGLGLSLVKKICEAYGIGHSYSYVDNQHLFTFTLSS